VGYSKPLDFTPSQKGLIRYAQFKGYRLMSRVEGIDAMDVKIGMRVKFKVVPGDEKTLPFPVFTPAGDAK
jgi:uncharacterized OB-fold protein